MHYQDVIHSRKIPLQAIGYFPPNQMDFMNLPENAVLRKEPI